MDARPPRPDRFRRQAVVSNRAHETPVARFERDAGPSTIARECLLISKEGRQSHLIVSRGAQGGCVGSDGLNSPAGANSK